MTYRVAHGYYNEHRETFDSFGAALAVYRLHSGATLTGADVDGDCDGDGFYMSNDGLSDEERDQL